MIRGSKAGLIEVVAVVVLVCELPAPLLAQAAGQVTNPSPANGSANVAVGTLLSWSEAANARGYDVRLGTASTPPVVLKNTRSTSYRPATPLQPGTKYYWQVDTRGRGSAVTPGPLWTFTTAAPPAAPGSPASPVPANGTTGVAVSTSIAWAAPTGATTYDVQFGSTNPPQVVSANQAATTFDPPGDLVYSTTYYWRVTAIGPGGSTPGPLWSFTTVSAPPSASLDRLRLMTWNVKAGQNLAGAASLDAQVELMADSDAHVILLQEVTITAQADLVARYESRLEALTGKEWYGVWAAAPRASTTTYEGNLILTTLPLISSSTLQMNSAPWDPTWLDTKRSAVQIAVAFNGITVHVFGTHLALNATHRRNQLETFQSWIATFPSPRVVGGDFNMVPGETAYNLMAANFADAWPALAPDDQGFTMDRRTSASNQPGRIDYWWQERTDTQARISEIWVVKTSRSDHHAVVIDVKVGE